MAVPLEAGRLLSGGLDLGEEGESKLREDKPVRQSAVQL